MDARPPHAGPGWADLARLDPLAAVLDPSDTAGAKNRAIDRVHKAALRRAVNPSAGVRILDFGCGTGRLSGWLADAGASVVGVDATPEMIEVARRRVPGTKFVVSEGGQLPFDDGSFDAVVAVYVLQYYVADQSIEVLLAEFHRLLSPGGAFVAIEQAADSDIGRGAPEARYEAVVTDAGFHSVATRRIRLGHSRALMAVQRWPRLAPSALLPAILQAEARLGGRRRPLVDGRYVDVLVTGLRS
jgi:SAM-dependent methyltransferase